MTEEFRLPVFFHFHREDGKIKNSPLKIVYVCEEQNEKIQKKLSEISDKIYEDLHRENLIQFLNQSESLMFQNYSKSIIIFIIEFILLIDLPDTKCVIIANHSLDQYTHYNFPRDFYGCNDNQLKWLRTFEKLHNQYVKAKRKKELCIKRVYELDSYLLYSKGDIFIYAVITHKGATREALEIGKQILADAKEIESTSFILRHI